MAARGLTIGFVPTQMADKVSDDRNDFPYFVLFGKARKYSFEWVKKALGKSL